MSPDELIPLTPAVFHILLALSDGQKHGYAIMQEVVSISAGQVKMGPGTLYGSIKRMLTLGLIEEADEAIDRELDDERRRYYRITLFGERVLKAEAYRLSQVMRALESKHILGDA
jgi:DNA-binding PadR family transcriptional regulator